MRFSRHEHSLHVKNFDILGDKDACRRHGDLLPNTIRGIICGPSNCGKTNVILSLLLD